MLSWYSPLSAIPHPEVWLGEYQGKKVAIKSMKDCLQDDKSLNQFLTEASVMT